MAKVAKMLASLSSASLNHLTICEDFLINTEPSVRSNFVDKNKSKKQKYSFYLRQSVKNQSTADMKWNK